MCPNYTINYLYISKMIDTNPFSKYDFYFKNLLPGQSIDCVIIGYDQEELQILVLKWKGTDTWSLPGGFIQLDEDMDSAAVRSRLERWYGSRATGLRSLGGDHRHGHGFVGPEQRLAHRLLAGGNFLEQLLMPVRRFEIRTRHHLRSRCLLPFY